MKKSKLLDRSLMIRAAERYAAADKSDPFTLSRAMAHLNNGIAEYANHNGESAYYDAEEATETRVIPDGKGGQTEYQAVVYRNRCRP